MMAANWHNATTATVSTLTQGANGVICIPSTQRDWFDEAIDDFREKTSTETERQRRNRERTRAALMSSRLDGRPALAAHQYHRPRRVGRACGRAHAVMLVKRPKPKPRPDEWDSTCSAT